MRAVAAEAEARDAARLIWTASAAARLLEWMVMMRWTEAATTSRSTCVVATPASSANLAMIVLRTVGVKSSRTPEAVMVEMVRNLRPSS